MEQWRFVAADLTVLDDDDVEKSRTLGGRVTKENLKRMRRSSVYRIYHIGVEEIRHRLSEDRAQGVRRGLAGRSIQAMRATLDGGLVRETQKINKLIVLLTICISGRPVPWAARHGGRRDDHVRRRGRGGRGERERDRARHRRRVARHRGRPGRRDSGALWLQLHPLPREGREGRHARLHRRVRHEDGRVLQGEDTS